MIYEIPMKMALDYKIIKFDASKVNKYHGFKKLTGKLFKDKTKPQSPLLNELLKITGLPKTIKKSSLNIAKVSISYDLYLFYINYVRKQLTRHKIENNKNEIIQTLKELFPFKIDYNLKHLQIRIENKAFDDFIFEKEFNADEKSKYSIKTFLEKEKPDTAQLIKLVTHVNKKYSITRKSLNNIYNIYQDDDKLSYINNLLKSNSLIPNTLHYINAFEKISENESDIKATISYTTPNKNEIIKFLTIIINNIADENNYFKNTKDAKAIDISTPYFRQLNKLKSELKSIFTYYATIENMFEYNQDTSNYDKVIKELLNSGIYQDTLSWLDIIN